jgi:hypothetical protein
VNEKMGIELRTFADCLEELNKRYKNIDVFLELTKANHFLKQYCGTLKHCHNEKELRERRYEIARQIVGLKYDRRPMDKVQ